MSQLKHYVGYSQQTDAILALALPEDRSDVALFSKVLSDVLSEHYSAPCVVGTVENPDALRKGLVYTLEVMSGSADVVEGALGLSELDLYQVEGLTTIDTVKIHLGDEALALKKTLEEPLGDLFSPNKTYTLSIEMESDGFVSFIPVGTELVWSSIDVFTIIDGADFKSLPEMLDYVEEELRKFALVEAIGHCRNKLVAKQHIDNYGKYVEKLVTELEIGKASSVTFSAVDVDRVKTDDLNIRVSIEEHYSL